MYISNYAKLIIEVEQMNDLINFLTSTEIIVVYIVVAVACLLCFIIYLLDKSYYKRKQRQNTKELNKLVETIKEEIVLEQQEEIPESPILYEQPILEPVNTKEPLKQEEPVIIKTEEKKEIPIIEQIEELNEISKSEDTTTDLENLISEISKKEESMGVLSEVNMEELEYTDIEPNQTEAQEQLKKLTEALEQAEEETKNIDLTEFEEEQEQNAIISIDELMQKTKAMYENNELEKFEDEGNEPISIRDLEERMNASKNNYVEEVEQQTIEPIQEKMVLDEFNNIKIEEPIEERKFKRSPVISPVYGIERENISTNELELENTANYDKLDEEIKKTNEFLMTLRELQKKLD